ncbi:HTH-type transcriptional regulator/antitoxin MqsA [Pseudoduganella flava]|uniref:HTH-type transcriptional regulator/antitoxin MqsA n=1 Tax=Pseudoduganella flava TaxID=871742 RepID=A0A562PXM2_9BURK|nr:type II TA system antitoxin MqsA family protein [Pseudoduganella flava]QGZ39903.1 YgiT-type zinc finger protein [Pseudoduganella flava]TWI48836.1 HTH-type transcriptional regulator/antitoxin MqsA [Pseudoduganella flava]
MIDLCPECGAADLVYDRHGVSYTYKDRHTTIPSVAAYHCAQCGGVTLDPAAVHRYDELVAQFHRRIDAEAADPAYIRTVRSKLRLDPVEADHVFGTDGFVHLETGRVQPHPSTLKLLKLLERHPELVDELRE